MHEKGVFRCTESIAMMPKSCDHMPTTSLWGVAAKWPTWTPKTKLILSWETHKDTAVSVWACQEGFWKSTRTLCQLRSKPHHGVYKILLTEVLATQMCMMRHSKKVSSFELYKFNPLLPHCRSCIAIPAVICELLQFAATQKAHIVNFFVDHTHTQFTEESKMATALTPQTDITSGKVTWLMENPRL